MPRLVVLVLLACVSSANAARPKETHSPGTVELSPAPLGSEPAPGAFNVLGLNASILATGSLAFEGGYDARDWSGLLRAVGLKADGDRSRVVWDAAAMLTDAGATPPGHRTILTAHMSPNGAVEGMAFLPDAAFDAAERASLMFPAPVDITRDTLAARVDYLRGVRSGEVDGVMRQRSKLLGAIIHSQAVYVSSPAARYVGGWPTTIRGIPVPAPEMAPGAQTYDAFAAAQAQRPPMIYVGANDGMLHAIHAPVPACKAIDARGDCSAYDAGAKAGRESWAYVPRGVYGSLGAFTQTAGFAFQPTVDATPVVRDVFFGERGSHEWHTLLAGGLRLGGRGVYALDITDPSKTSEASPGRTVLWEFDADAPPGIAQSGAPYRPADLGYTYGQPAIARLASGRWAVLVPSGYFADCSKPDRPANCEAASGAPPSGYSALFVLDAQTGSVVAELATPTDISGVTSHGLSTPVLGDTHDDAIDDVAFAGDLDGNLWRFDLSSPDPSAWKVTLAFRPEVPGVQPITTMPRLFPDTGTHRFIVVFGTGKYLGAGDDTDNVPTQSVYGIRDLAGRNGKPVTVTRAMLQRQTLSQETVSEQADPLVGATVRSLASHPLPPGAGGWHIDLDAIPGERVVTPPFALFNTNTVLIHTLIPGPGGSPGTTGAVMAIDASTGGAGNPLGLSGGRAYVGALVESKVGAGSLPVATAIGGGPLILPGMALKGAKAGLASPLSFASPLWRRRSWSVLTLEP